MKSPSKYKIIENPIKRWYWKTFKPRKYLKLLFFEALYSMSSMHTQTTSEGYKMYREFLKDNTFDLGFEDNNEYNWKTEE